MKKQLLILLALVALLCGCPTGPVDVGVEASAFAPATSVDAAIDAAPHRLSSFNPTATGTGFPHVTSGVQDSASVKVDTTNAAHVTVPAAGIVSSSGTVLQQCANDVCGTNFISIGGTPAIAGHLRLPTLGQVFLRDNANATDRCALSSDTNDFLFVGTNGVGGGINNQFARVFVYASGQVQIGTSAAGLTVNTTNVLPALPIIGDSTPYGVHGKATVATAPPFTLAAADYAMDAIMLSSATAGTVTFPTVAANTGAYYKTVINTGAGTKTLSDGGASTPTLATNLSGHYLFDTAGVHLTGPSVAYP